MSNISSKTYQIGYALALEKEKTFILPSTHSHASQNDNILTKIDPTKPLIEQGPLDCIIHRLYDVTDWNQNLQHFASQNPNILSIDSPNSIQILHDIISMLEAVSKLKIMKVGVPKQIIVTEAKDLENPKLNFPLIAKPLKASGSETSHNMHLVFEEDGLKDLTMPFVLQDFVNHVGVMFKVYAAGKYHRCTKQMSLADILEEKMESLKGSKPFSKVSYFVGGEGVEFEKKEMEF